VAMVPGTDPALAGQVVVVGAHFDHLGRSTAGALDPQAGNAIRNGADDNASGTAAVLALARHFAARPARRSIVVANFTAEELGLLGSQWFVEHSPVPLDSIVAMVNFDMVGRLKNDRLIVYGVGTARELRALVDSANGDHDFRKFGGDTALTTSLTLHLEERDVAGMADRLERLLANPSLATRMGRAARDHIASEFAVERRLAQLWSIIEAAIQRREMPGSAFAELQRLPSRD